MKAIELRIGNLVTIDGNVVEIYEIAHGVIEIANGMEPYSINDIEPIPLTKEWLVKFGFEKPSYSWNGDIFHLSEWGQSPLNWCVAMNKNGAMLVQKLKYVHQLQNLYYALTNQELTCN